MGLVVEAISGQPFTDYIMEHIFAPSGMMRSGYFALDQLPPQTALGYFQDEDAAWHTNIYSIPVVGGPDGGDGGKGGPDGDEERPAAAPRGVGGHEQGEASPGEGT